MLRRRTLFFYCFLNAFLSTDDTVLKRGTYSIMVVIFCDLTVTLFFYLFLVHSSRILMISRRYGLASLGFLQLHNIPPGSEQDRVQSGSH